MIMNICFIGLERMVFERPQQVIDGIFKLFVAIIGESAPV